MGIVNVILISQLTVDPMSKSCHQSGEETFSQGYSLNLVNGFKFSYFCTKIFLQKVKDTNLDYAILMDFGGGIVFHVWLRFSLKVSASGEIRFH